MGKFGKHRPRKMFIRGCSQSWKWFMCGENSLKAYIYVSTRITMDNNQFWPCARPRLNGVWLLLLWNELGHVMCFRGEGVGGMCLWWEVFSPYFILHWKQLWFHRGELLEGIFFYYFIQVGICCNSFHCLPVAVIRKAVFFDGSWVMVFS